METPPGPDLLMAAGIDRAKVLIIAIDDPDKVTHLADYAIKTYPNLHVIASARNRHHVYELWRVGCRDIIRETYDSALRIGRSAFEGMGIPREKSDKMVEAFNDMDRRSMLEVADLYDPAIPASENEAYVARVREIRGPWQDELGKEMQDIPERLTWQHIYLAAPPQVDRLWRPQHPCTHVLRCSVTASCKGNDT